MDGITDASVFCISESGHRDHADRDLLARGRLARTAASQEVVLRVHFKPVIGFFDARDDFRRFFHRFSATACGADPLDFDVLRQQLSAASPNGAYVETEELGDARITAASGLQGFEPRIEAPLLFVEQAEEQHDGRP
ncbi:MAG: hypothetical protein JW751_27165 [Polyangiaceae bacterium]|nr:hypothetical protein [Polyangiaceae bacterium]